MRFDRPGEPWHSFLLEIDGMLDRALELHCIGGFTMAMLYGLARPTVDVDCLAVIPTGEISWLHAVAGEGSALHKKYGAYVQHTGVVTVPDDYSTRLRRMFPGTYDRLTLLGLEAHDLALSKLERNSARDREDVRFLARAVPLDASVLENRYHAELRPYLSNTERHDLTLRLWLEMI